MYRVWTGCTQPGARTPGEGKEGNKLNKLKRGLSWLLKGNIKPINCVIITGAAAFLAFGLYQVHALSGVTEGGILGLTLLLEHWFHISPAVSGLFLNACCYLMAWRLLGKEFLVYSSISAMAFSIAYKIYEQFEPLWPQLRDMPLLAALAGAVFVGVGAGLCVRCGGATGGDDALAMSISHVLKVRIDLVYLLSDVVVLILSVTYIPLTRIGYSLLTVILSGQLIGLIQRAGQEKKEAIHAGK